MLVKVAPGDMKKMAEILRVAVNYIEMIFSPFVRSSLQYIPSGLLGDKSAVIKALHVSMVNQLTDTYMCYYFAVC